MLKILIKGATRARTYQHEDITIKLQLDPPNGDERTHLSSSRYAVSGPKVGNLFERVSVASVRFQGAEEIADQMEAYGEDAAGRAFSKCVSILEGVKFEGDTSGSTNEELLYHHGPDWLLKRVIRDLLGMSSLSDQELGNSGE